VMESSRDYELADRRKNTGVEGVIWDFVGCGWGGGMRV